MKKVSQTIAFLRFEGLAILVGALVGYGQTDVSWWWFALGLLIPDISMTGYAINNKVGAFVYNLGHSLVLPIGVLISAFIVDSPYAMAIGLIWLAHIGMDRAFGYGLKEQDFQHTHLGKIGKRK